MLDRLDFPSINDASKSYLERDPLKKKKGLLKKKKRGNRKTMRPFIFFLFPFFLIERKGRGAFWLELAGRP